jgi:uncharacterized membrane protein YqjE
VRRLADSTTKLIQHRLELLSLDLHEQKVRLVDILFRLAAMIVLGILALVTATATIVVFLWDWSPRLTLLGLTLLYGGLALTLGLGVRRQLREEPRPFHDSIEQFKKDREWLDKRNSGASRNARNG